MEHARAGKTFGEPPLACRRPKVRPSERADGAPTQQHHQLARLSRAIWPSRALMIKLVTLRQASLFLFSTNVVSVRL